MIRTSALRRETRIPVICDLSISVNINDAFNQQTIEWLSFWNFQRFSLGVIVLSVYLKLVLLNMDAKIWYKKAALESHNSLSAYERKTASSRTSSVNWLLIKKYSIKMKSSWVLILSLGLITVSSVSKAKPFGEELIPRDIGDAIEFDDGWLTKKKGEFF